MLYYLTRHGETKWNIERKTQGIQDVALTEKGRLQAHKLGKRLLNEKIEKIYCSDLSRAFETAGILGEYLKLIPISTSLLREVCFGNWEGLTLEEIELCYPGELETWNLDMNFSPRGGESINMAQQRIRSFIELLKKQDCQNENVLIVSHALTCKILILELLDMPTHCLSSLRKDNTALTIIQASSKNPNKMYLSLFNDTCHLTSSFFQRQ